MALSGALAKGGFNPEHVHVTAAVTFGPVEDGFAVQGIRLTVEGVVPGIDDAAFQEHAESAKVGCPISKALTVPIELEARLVEHA